jgi:hypothetical protein
MILAMPVTAALVAGCAGTPSPIAPASQVANALKRSWISPEAKKQPLLYVSSVLTNDVYVYAYSSRKLVGTLTGFETPYGLCVDTSGDVWVVNDGAQNVVEYAHGGSKPIATLPDRGEYPEGCSVDPTTGNLAVTNFSSNSGSGSVSIYAGAQGNPQTYSDPTLLEYRFCGYDDRGNLFVDGAGAGSTFAFAELPKGSATFTDITLSQSVEWPGGVQWTGKDVAVGDTDAHVIYEVAGRTGKVKRSTQLTDANYVNQFWITGKKVVAASQDANAVGY